MLPRHDQPYGDKRGGIASADGFGPHNASDNRDMADASVTVTLIAAAAPIVAGSIPLIVSAVRDGQRDRRGRQEQVAKEREAVCARLLRMARDLRVLVENFYEYNGEEKKARAWEIRRRAGKIRSQADQVGLMLFSLDVSAGELADAAGSLAAWAADPESLKLKTSTHSPDFEEFDKCVRQFKAAAMTALYQRPARSRWRSLRRGSRRQPELLN